MFCDRIAILSRFLTKAPYDSPRLKYHAHYAEMVAHSARRKRNIFARFTRICGEIRQPETGAPSFYGVSPVCCCQKKENRESKLNRKYGYEHIFARVFSRLKLSIRTAVDIKIRHMINT